MRVARSPAVARAGVRESTSERPIVLFHCRPRRSSSQPRASTSPPSSCSSSTAPTSRGSATACASGRRSGAARPAASRRCARRSPAASWSSNRQRPRPPAGQPNSGSASWKTAAAGALLPRRTHSGRATTVKKAAASSHMPIQRLWMGMPRELRWCRAGMVGSLRCTWRARCGSGDGRQPTGSRKVAVTLGLTLIYVSIRRRRCRCRPCWHVAAAARAQGHCHVPDQSQGKSQSQDRHRSVD